MGDQVDSAPLVSDSGVSSLLWAGYPGQDGGTAIMNILTGKTAPAGRLPVTQYPVSCSTIPEKCESNSLTSPIGSVR